eukprot:95739-Pelagomonas_calceolata.AAC.1
MQAQAGMPMHINIHPHPRPHQHSPVVARAAHADMAHHLLAPPQWLDFAATVGLGEAMGIDGGPRLGTAAPVAAAAAAALICSKLPPRCLLAECPCSCHCHRCWWCAWKRGLPEGRPPSKACF